MSGNENNGTTILVLVNTNGKGERPRELTLAET